jgi:hypothetical protein
MPSRAHHLRPQQRRAADVAVAHDARMAGRDAFRGRIHRHEHPPRPQMPDEQLVYDVTRPDARADLPTIEPEDE